MVTGGGGGGGKGAGGVLQITVMFVLAVALKALSMNACWMGIGTIYALVSIHVVRTGVIFVLYR